MTSLTTPGPHSATLPTHGRHPAWLQRDWARPGGLLMLALLSALGYATIAPISRNAIPPMASMALLVGLVAIPYALACWWVVSGQAPADARWRTVEWITILGGAGVFFALVFALPPLLSGDLYRYVWDARLTAHGFSPYVAAPESPAFQSLRDAVIYPRLEWLHVPTIYPPGAQGLFLIAYLVAPSNIWAIKLEMVIFTAVAAFALGRYLHARGQDPRRVLIFLWAPLVVIEFGLNAHADVVAIALWMLALLLSSTATWRGTRVLIGVLLALATLVKLYPAILLLALVRRGDRGLYAAFGVTLLLGYAPFWRDGVRVLGFLPAYLSSARDYTGLVYAIGGLLALLGADMRLGQVIDVGLAAVAVGGIALLRRRGLLASDQSVLALLLVWLTFSPQLAPWYAAALVPLCTILLERPAPRSAPRWRSTLPLVLWAFPGVILALYLPLAQGRPPLLYGVTYVFIVLAAMSILAAQWSRSRDRDGWSARPAWQRLTTAWISAWTTAWTKVCAVDRWGGYNGRRTPEHVPRRHKDGEHARQRPEASPEASPEAR